MAVFEGHTLGGGRNGAVAEMLGNVRVDGAVVEQFAEDSLGFGGDRVKTAEDCLVFGAVLKTAEDCLVFRGRGKKTYVVDVFPGVGVFEMVSRGQGSNGGGRVIRIVVGAGIRDSRGRSD